MGTMTNSKKIKSTHKRERKTVTMNKYSPSRLDKLGTKHI